MCERSRQRQYFDGEGPVTLQQWVDGYRSWLKALRSKYPQATIAISTIYDPTEGSGRLQGGGDISRVLPHLLAINQAIREIAAADENLLLADIHRHFEGHTREWLYREIEPTQRGSSEVRRLFLQVFGQLPENPGF